MFIPTLWERLCRWVAWRLPRKVVTWAVIRAWAYATTGEFSDEPAPGCLVVDALKRWDP